MKLSSVGLAIAALVIIAASPSTTFAQDSGTWRGPGFSPAADVYYVRLVQVEPKEHWCFFYGDNPFPNNTAVVFQNADYFRVGAPTIPPFPPGAKLALPRLELGCFPVLDIAPDAKLAELRNSILKHASMNNWINCVGIY
jgi:hypothetical protein